MPESGLRVCGAIIATLLAAPFCLAAYSTTRPVGEMFAELGSADVAVRESARSGLMRLTREDLPALRDAVTKARPLRPAQSSMLRQIVQEIFLASEEYDRDKQSGFMGIIMGDMGSEQADFVPDNQLPTTIGVIVAERLPGFCASRKLRDGDVLLGIVSPTHLFANMGDLKRTIGGLRPGTTVRLLVLRCGQVMEVDLTLDAKPAASENPDAVEAFRSRRQRKFDDYWGREFEPLLRSAIG